MKLGIVTFAATGLLSLVVLPIAAHAHGHAAGSAIYQSAGCVACHGPDARGTAVGPPLAGHTAQQVRHSVRNPQGIMPRFGEDKISSKEIEKLAAYIASLEAHPGDAASGFPGALEAHHWMAHQALRLGDAEHALHHLTHARDVAADEAHRAGIERALALVRAKRLEQAAHAVVTMVSSSVRPEMPIDKLHLKLALGAIDDGNAKEARHHLRHFADVSRGHDRRHAEQLLELVERGNLAQAKKRLAHMM
jgi:cytochrome c553